MNYKVFLVHPENGLVMNFLIITGGALFSITYTLMVKFLVNKKAPFCQPKQGFLFAFQGKFS